MPATFTRTDAGLACELRFDDFMSLMECLNRVAEAALRAGRDLEFSSTGGRALVITIPGAASAADQALAERCAAAVVHANPWARQPSQP